MFHKHTQRLFFNTSPSTACILAEILTLRSHSPPAQRGRLWFQRSRARSLRLSQRGQSLFVQPCKAKTDTASKKSIKNLTLNLQTVQSNIHLFKRNKTYMIYLFSKESWSQVSKTRAVLEHLNACEQTESLYPLLLNKRVRPSSYYLLPPSRSSSFYKQRWHANAYLEILMKAPKYSTRNNQTPGPWSCLPPSPEAPIKKASPPNRPLNTSWCHLFGWWLSTHHKL